MQPYGEHRIIHAFVGGSLCRLSRQGLAGLVLFAGLLCWVAPARAAVVEETLARLPRAGVPLADVLAAAPRLGLAQGPVETLPALSGISLHLALPASDDCAPRAAFLLCPGLQVAAEGSPPGARVAGLWYSAALPVPEPAARLRAQLQARLGPPASAETVTERRRGRDLDMVVLRWPGGPAPLEVMLVLEDRGADPAAPRQVRMLGFASVLEGRPDLRAAVIGGRR
jgi:hypothetical protein